MLIVCASLCTLSAIIILRKDYDYKKVIQFPFVEGDFKATNQNVFRLTLVGLSGGFAVGLVGIGIGTLLIPVFINELSLHPIVSA